jgi:ribonuclease-3
MDIGATVDNKTALQTYVQKTPGNRLCYAEIGEEGPDHAKIFKFEVRLNGEVLAYGEGRNKQEAEQTAAGRPQKLGLA